MADDKPGEAATLPLAPQGDQLEPGTAVGGYVIDAKIGEGGMGTVYGAHHPRTGKRVAIKVLAPAYCSDPATVERFEQEARIVNEIRHPNIVDVFQFGEIPERRSFFFVMEWLEGESLSERIERKPLALRTTVEILEVICDALDAAHEKGVIHRDLKSDNVFLVTQRGKSTVKLLDFGLAKLAGRGDPAAIGRTRSGVLVGTPAYMSPEQARGKAVDPRTDIYALGVLAYKMLTGRLPYKADNAMDLIVMQLNAPVPDASKLAPSTPPRLTRLVTRMMAKQPDERPSLGDVRKLLGELKTELGAAKADVPTPQGRPLGPLAALATVATLLVGVIGFGAYELFGKHDQPAASEHAPAPSPGSETAPPAPPTPANDPPQIEIDPTPPPTAAPALAPALAPTDAGAHHHHHHQDPVEPEPTEVTPTQPPANRPGSILLIVDRAATIELDGQIIAQQSRGGTYEVKPGHHTLRVKPPDHQAVERSVDLGAGETSVLSVDFPNTASPGGDPGPSP